jgi:hypothetical protein
LAVVAKERQKATSKRGGKIQAVVEVGFEEDERRTGREWTFVDFETVRKVELQEFVKGWTAML